MKNKEKGALGFSVIAVILSIIAIAVAVYRSPELGFDYQGIIVAMLSLAVTFFVAVQIYQSFTLKRDIDHINNSLYERMKKENEGILDSYIKRTDDLVGSLKNDVERIISKRIEDYDHTVSASVFQVFSHGLMMQHKDKAALDCLMKALEAVFNVIYQPKL